MIILILIFLALTFSGLVLFNSLIKTTNKFLLLGGGMIVGILGFLLVLSLASYVLKGSLGIKIIFLSFLTCLFIFTKYFKNETSRPMKGWCFPGFGNRFLFLPASSSPMKGRGIRRSGNKTIWKNLFHFRLTATNVFIFLVLMLYIFLIFIYASSFNVGADADIYWGIANSFTRGNYPTVLPWQPNFLTVYHQGTFVVEGAIRALAPVGIAAIHNFFSAFILSAILFFITGVVREKIRSVWCLLPAILGLFYFGGPILLIGGLQNFIINISSFNQFPTHESFRGSNGSGASDIVGLMYINFYTFGLASFLIFIYIYFLQTKLKFNFRTYVILIILSVLSGSIDETFFAVEIVLLVGLFIWQIRRERISKFLLSTFSLSLVFLVFFALIQNPIRDSLLTPSPDLPRFKLSLESDNPIFSKYMYGKNEHILWNGKDTGVTALEKVKDTLNFVSQKEIKLKGTEWHILDLKLLSVAIFITSFLIRSNLSLFFTISGILSIFFAILVVNTYWPPNNLRFANQASQLIIFGLGFLMVDFIAGRRNKLKLLFFTLILILLIPQFLVTHAKFLRLTFSGNHQYFTKNLIDLRLAEIEDLIPSSARIIFLDQYPTDANSTYLNSSAVNRHGLFVPFSPPKPKVLSLEKGMEWYDAVNNLSPYSFKILNIDFVYIQDIALKRLSKERIEQLNNSLYFQKIKDWDDARLYKVNKPFKDIIGDEMSIKKIVSIIGMGKKVYLDKFHLNELRQMFLLNLSKQNQLVGHPFAHGGDFFMYIEEEIPFEDACKIPPCDPKVLKALDDIEYALMKPENDPNVILQGKYQKIASVKHVDLWQNIQKQ